MLAAMHGRFGALMPTFATRRYDNLFFSHMICHPFDQMAACLDIVAGGRAGAPSHPARKVATPSNNARLRPAIEVTKRKRWGTGVPHRSIVAGSQGILTALLS
ncbi:MAG: hypothetical protein U1E60_01795 [Reyranellaceae bacterium]